MSRDKGRTEIATAAEEPGLESFDPLVTVKRRRLKILAIVFVGLLLFTAQRLGIFTRLGEPARLAETLRGLGGLGYLAFVVTYALLQPFGVPGTVFIVAAPLIWPWPIAFCLSMVGSMAASVIGFSFSRLVARDWLSPRIPARFRKYDQSLAERAFYTVFFLRLIFWMPPLLHAFFGVSKVRFWTHFWGSLAGYVLPLFLVSFFGARLVTAIKSAPAFVWVVVGIVLLSVVAALILRQRRRVRPRP